MRYFRVHGLARCNNMASVVSCFCGCVYLFEILLSLAVSRRHSKALLLATAAVDIPSVHTHVHQGSWPSRPCSLESLLRQLSFDNLMIMIQVVNIQDHNHRCHQFASSMFFSRIACRRRNALEGNANPTWPPRAPSSPYAKVCHYYCCQKAR